MNITKSLLIFAAGAVVGALGMRYYIHKQLENAEYEEGEYEQEVENPIEESIKAPDKGPTIAEYAASLAKNRQYIDYASISTKSKETLNKQNQIEEDKNKDSIYLIDGDEYGQVTDYDLYTFSYYADGVLEDDAGDAMTEEEIQTTIGGREVLALLDRTNVWVIYIRNDTLEAEYEICLDRRRYSDIHPPQKEALSEEDGD